MSFALTVQSCTLESSQRLVFSTGRVPVFGKELVFCWSTLSGLMISDVENSGLPRVACFVCLATWTMRAKPQVHHQVAMTIVQETLFGVSMNSLRRGDSGCLSTTLTMGPGSPGSLRKSRLSGSSDSAWFGLLHTGLTKSHEHVMALKHEETRFIHDHSVIGLIR